MPPFKAIWRLLLPTNKPERNAECSIAEPCQEAKQTVQLVAEVGLGTPQRGVLMKWVQEAGFIEADECRYKP